MNELQTLQVQLALEIEIGRMVRRYGGGAFPPRPEFVWAAGLMGDARESARVENARRLAVWQDEIRAWKRGTLAERLVQRSGELAEGAERPSWFI